MIPLPDDQAPEHVRRRYARSIAICALVVVGVPLVKWAAGILWPRSFGAPPLGPAIRVGFAAIALGGASVAALAVLTARWERRLVARLAEFQFQLCPRCAYPLPGRTGKTICPECGRACDMKEVEQAWRAFRPRYGWLGRRRKNW